MTFKLVKFLFKTGFLHGILNFLMNTIKNMKKLKIYKKNSLKKQLKLIRDKKISIKL